jgi:Family of unknown function (DUF6152)
MNREMVALIVGTIAVLAAAVSPVTAHHSQAQYTGPEGAIEISGVVVRVEMTNPHSFLYVDVEKDGKKVLWALEMQSRRGLAMNGWADDTVKVGDRISAIGRPARNGAPAMYCEVVKLPDGRQMRS